MSDLLGGKTLIDTPADRQIIVVGQADFDAAKRQFSSVLPVVAVNGPDTDVSALFGRPVVLIGDAALAHADMLFSVRGDAIIKAIYDEIDPWAEAPAALAWAKEKADVYQPSTGAAQAVETSGVIPFSPPSAPDAAPTLSEPPPHVLETPPDDPLAYPDSSAFIDHDAPHSARIAVEDEWPEPSDIFEQSHAEPFPNGILPDWLDDFVSDVAARQGTAAAYTAVGVVPALAAAADDSWRVQPKQKDHSWTVRPCLWSFVVGGSSSGKSPGIEAAFKALETLDMERRIEVVQKDKDFARAMKVYAEQEKDYLQKAKKDASVIFEVPEPQREPDKVLMFSDINIPAAGEFLKNHPRGMCVYVKELSSWVGNMDAYTKGSGERGYWLSSFDGGPQVVKRIGRGEIVVPNFSACVSGGITPAALRAALGKGQLNSDGLLQRALIGLGNGTQTAGEDRAPDVAASSAYTRVLGTLLDWDADLGRVLKFSPDATDAYLEYLGELRETIRMSDFADGHLSHLGKFAGMIPRLALTLYLADRAHTHKFPDYSAHIELSVMESAIAFFRWQESHIRAFWTEVISPSGVSMQAQKIALWIIGKGDEILRNADIQNSLGSTWDDASVADRLKIISTLTDAGFIQSIHNGRKFSGVLPVAHRINPRVFEKFAHMIGPERERREAFKAFLKQKQLEAAARRGQTLQ